MSVYISEFNAYSANGGDFVEVVAPTGTDLSGYSVYVYDRNATFKAAYSFGNADSKQFKQDVYVLDAVNDGFSLSALDNIALVDGDGQVIQFLGEDGNTIKALDGPIAGQISIGSGTWGSTYSQETRDGGSSYQPQYNTNKGTLPCFAPGTLIETRAGLKPVETLVAGDVLVTTRGKQAKILWAHSCSALLSETAQNELPILIQAGALGNNVPSSDLVVSPNHRIYVGNGRQLQDLFDEPALVPAKSLTILPGIRVMLGRKHIVWHHFACAAHHTIFANGCAAETLLLGPMVLNGLNAAEFGAVMSISWPGPGSQRTLNGPPCLPCLSTRQARNKIRAAQALTAA